MTQDGDGAREAIIRRPGYGPYPFGRGPDPQDPGPSTRTPADHDNGPDLGDQPVSLGGIPAHHVAVRFLSGRERCACGYEGTRNQVSTHLVSRNSRGLTR